MTVRMCYMWYFVKGTPRYWRSTRVFTSVCHSQLRYRQQQPWNIYIYCCFEQIDAHTLSVLLFSQGLALTLRDFGHTYGHKPSCKAM